MAKEMNLAEYQKHLSQIGYGKVLPGALYLFWEPTTDLGAALNQMVIALKNVYGVGSEFNVIKFRTDELKLSFLFYPDFLDDPHPALHKSVSIDLVKGKVRRIDYAANINPPILHRKESFLPPSHPSWLTFRGLTQAEEQAGLFEDTATIGFRLNWERLLDEKGVVLDGHRLERSNSSSKISHGPVPTVDRHKTAMRRYELSKPVKCVLEHNLLKPGTTFFDCGCGQGSDVRGLQSLGYSAEGWDPVFRPSVPKIQADVVNFGYVLNVIEDPAERLVALVDAYRQTNHLLVVSALINETVEIGRSAVFRDGVLTKRNTFQKFFDQQELHQYIEDALETTAIPVALGIFFVFRNPAEQQDFLSVSSRRPIDWSEISTRLGLGRPQRSKWRVLYEKNRQILDEFGGLTLRLGRFPESSEFAHEQTLIKELGSLSRALRTFVLGNETLEMDWAQVAKRFGIGQPKASRWETVYEENKELLSTFWKEVLCLGRLPSSEEFPRIGEIVDKIGSAKRALRLFLLRGGGKTMKEAAENRRNDLLVYVALANLRRKVPFGHLSLSVRLDVKEFFGSYKTALEKGLELLYSTGDTGEIELACEDLAFGWQDQQALYVHRSLLKRLPPILLAYVGCATTLFGAVEQADVIKIHKSSGKVTFLVYDAFDTKPLPELQRRIKVNLRTQFVQVFDHSGSGQLLYFKERYVASDYQGIEGFKAFSAKLVKLGIGLNTDTGPSKDELAKLLHAYGLNENLNKRRVVQRPPC
jgi:hypothetical protein